MGSAQRNVRLCVLHRVTQYTPLYWSYMFHLVTQVRGLSATDFGLLKGLYYLSVVALELPLGVVADRLGRRAAMLAGALFNSLACLLYIQATTFAEFAVAEVCFALATAWESGASSALLYDSLRAESRTDEYARAEGLCRSAALAVGTIGYAASDWLFVHDGDPTAAYAATAVISMVGFAAALALTEPPRGSHPRARTILRSAWADLRNIPQIPLLLVYGALMFVLFRAANAFLFNPVLATSGVAVNGYGTVMAAMGLLGAVAAWQTHRVLARSRRAILLAALPLSLGAMYALLATVHGPAAIPILASQGLALGMLPVVTASLLNDLIPSSERRATLLSLESLFSRGSYGLASIALGTALDRAGLEPLLIVLACAALLPLLLIPALARRSGAG
jgi:MFS family permease